MIRMIVLGTVFTVFSSIADAQSASSQPQPAPPAATSNPLDKVVCKTEDTLGTRLGAHRVCATVREWQEQAEENRKAAGEIQGMGPGVPETKGAGPGSIPN